MTIKVSWSKTKVSERDIGKTKDKVTKSETRHTKMGEHEWIQR